METTTSNSNNMFFAEENIEIFGLLSEIGSNIQFRSLTRSMLDFLPADKKDIILENKLIIEIERDTFHRFLQMQKINLSNNLITNLDPELFSVHNFLEEIDLKHNSLLEINKNLLLYSPVLLKLNYSFNSITTIEENCIFSFSLIDLDLSHNNIEIVHSQAFFYLPELKILNLSYNRIKNLQLVSSRLVELNANNNQLQFVDFAFSNIKQVLLEKNYIFFIQNITIINNGGTITELNFSNNESDFGVNEIFENTFKNMTSLLTLRLNVNYFFDFNCLKYLTHLNVFTLSYHGTQNLSPRSKTIGEMLAVNQELHTFLLTVKNFESIYLQNMYFVSSLKNFRLKCLNAKPIVTNVDIREIFAQNTQLKEVELSDLNWFTVPKRGKRVMVDKRPAVNLRRLYCSGIKNVVLDNYFGYFTNLISLKISHGLTIYFKDSAFADLKNLKFLYLENLQLVKIKKCFVRHNLKLEILSFENNLIFSIAKYTFSKLSKLKYLNLKGNPLVASGIDVKTFYGLKKFGTVIELDDNSLLQKV